MFRAFDRLLAAGQEVIAFHVLDPSELDLDLAGVGDFDDSGARFRELESGRIVDLSPGRIRAAYREAVEAHVAALRRGLGRRGIDYQLIDTATPLDFALFRYLAERERRRRIR